MLPFPNKDSKVIEIKESITDHKYGCYPEKRDLKERLRFGVVNLDKPKGPTSHQIADRVSNILGLKKAGHSGTLDPKVTGCLPISLERASRISYFLLNAGKEYVCLMKFHKEISENEALETINSFVGKIRQKPPVRSAVKRVEREREIYYINILDVELPYVLFKVGCQAGTYIRKLCFDIGQKALVGANMVQLVRTRAGPFEVEDSVSIVDLQDAFAYYNEGDEKELKKMILPPERAFSHMKSVWVSDNACGNISYGSDLFVSGVVRLHDDIRQGEIVAIFSLKNEIVATGVAMMDADKLEEKGVFVKTSKTFMEPGVYPK